jgi:hypothetical protein
VQFGAHLSTKESYNIPEAEVQVSFFSYAGLRIALLLFLLFFLLGILQIGVPNQGPKLVRILHFRPISPCFQLLSILCHCMHLTLPGSLALQPCPAALPGSLARQPCPAALPGSLARQPCPAALPGSLAQQTCPAVRPISTGFDAALARSAVTALFTVRMITNSARKF